MVKFVKKMQKRLADNKRKGFTLVELIVVLVILAILAAMLVPALTGYINRARQRTVLVEARNVLTAAQAYESELYGTNTDYSGSVHSSVDLGDLGGFLVEGDYNDAAEVNYTTNDNGKIIALDYTVSGTKVSYDSSTGEWEETDA